jgi:hypothetical protein
MEMNTVLADGINSIAIHNNIVRIEFMRIAMNGRPQPCIELQVPLDQIRSISEALKNVAGR